MWFKSYKPFDKDYKSNYKNIKLHKLRTYGDAYSEIPAETIMSKSYYLLGILVLEIIMDEILF